MDNNLDNSLPEEALPPVTRSKWGGFLLEILQTVILAVVLYFLIDTVVARVRVENISMLPTLQPGEFVLVSKFAYKTGEPHRGDVVIFHFPQDPKEDYVKRIIGLPGDDVKVVNEKLYVNDQPLEEDYIAAKPTYTGNWKVPENDLFVLGDNRNQSSDSHSWGYVPMANVVGKALVIYWPPTKIRLLDQPVVVSAAN